ncbi:PQQ-binding-like beta-propeller repeat protein [Actinomadura sp. NPDC047616]|uniref:PQQ-binding-like beta-propeller repeat protein n=1 Tax=Actinomadura sp. NPDC047616 TaxID=3155914 RepID=UPI0034037E6C
MGGRRFGGRRRAAVGVVCGVLAVAVCGVLVVRAVTRAEWWQVRHSVTAVPVAPLADVGPPPGPLATSWQRSAPVHRGPLAGYNSVAFEVAHGQAVLASGGGLDVRDARTGGERWSYRRMGWTMLGWAATGSRLVGYFERDGDRGERMMVGFDALSGAELWRQADETPASVARTTLRWPAGSDAALTTSGDRRVLYGRSAANGARLWTQRLPAGCRLFEGAAHASDSVETTAVLALDCAKGPSRLIAVRPDTGAVRWTRPLESAEAPEVTVLDGVTLADDGTALRAYRENGHRLAEWGGENVCGDAICPAVVAGGRLVVAYRPNGARRGERRLEAVETASGQAAWRRDAPAYAALAAAGGRIYALRPRLSGALLPAGVDVVEPGDGGSRTVAAPFAMDPELDGARPWLAAAGGLLYAAVPTATPRPGGAARLVALRGGSAGPGPAELGGTPAADWPDACALLKRPDLLAARLDPGSARPGGDRIGEQKLPHPVSCTYEAPERDGLPDAPPLTVAPSGGPSEQPSGVPAAPRDSASPDRPGSASPSASASGGGVSGKKSPGKDGDRRTPEPSASGPGTDDDEWGARSLTVTVKWVAPTGQAASALMETLRAVQSQARRRTDIGGDEAYELGPTAGTIAVRVDRYIVVVTAARPPGAASRLARAAAVGLTGGAGRSPEPS